MPNNRSSPFIPHSSVSDSCQNHLLRKCEVEKVALLNSQSLSLPRNKHDQIQPKVRYDSLPSVECIKSEPLNLKPYSNTFSSHTNANTTQGFTSPPQWQRFSLLFESTCPLGQTRQNQNESETRGLSTGSYCSVMGGMLQELKSPACTRRGRQQPASPSRFRATPFPDAHANPRNSRLPPSRTPSVSTV